MDGATYSVYTSVALTCQIKKATQLGGLFTYCEASTKSVKSAKIRIIRDY